MVKKGIKFLNRIKQHLIKKVIIERAYVNQYYLNYVLKLTNFWARNKEIKAELWIDQKLQIIPFEFKRDTLIIQLPKDQLNNIESRAVIKLFINGRKMWITTSPRFIDNNRNMLINNQLFFTSVNKNIRLLRNFPEFKFNENHIKISNCHFNYNEIAITLDGIITGLKEQSQVYAFSGNRLREVLATYDDELNRLKISDFSLFARGLWQLFININDELYPLSFNKQKGVTSFQTFLHNVESFFKGQGFYLNFNPHILECESISINNSYEDDKIHIKLNLGRFKKGEYSLIIEDVNTHKETSYQLSHVGGNSIGTRVEIKDLSYSFARKRFFIVYDNGAESIKYQFNLQDAELTGDSVVFDEIINSQVITFTFYKRKDNSLGLRMPNPKIEKLITKINNFKLEGYIGSLEKFLECQAYLLIEERYTQESIRVPILDNFSVDLNNLRSDLINLKSKDKTIMDFFIIIKSTKDVLVRKEKIKYQFAEYKKDNYYDYKHFKDKGKNQHHFLLTTTPAGNLKLETFTIPTTVQIPEDTSRKDKNIWLIGERYNTAQENGITLFKWLTKNTSIEVYYVIEKDAPDYNKIKHYSNVLTFGSDKHYEIAFKAKVLLGTHDLENLLPYKPARGFFHYENTIRVFLQHGVLGRKTVEYHKKYYDLPFNIFIVSSEPEKHDIVVNQLGYNEDEVFVTGLARFDNLMQTSEPKDILLMPTWRDWINTDQRFYNSKYYAKYTSLIQNKKLLKLLEDYDVYLNFYPHYRAQIFFNNKMKGLNRRVKFISFGTRSVQELLKQHALLITDYSSVSFDFILMGKPVIYYHFDVRRFFRQGILRPVDETFIGKIAITESDIVSLIEDRIINSFQNYKVDISEVIKYKDENNCKRIYQVVYNKMIKEKLY